MAPPVRYARCGALSIAYQVLGTGGPDLVFVPGLVSHLDLAWEEPFLSRSPASQVIQFSDRTPEAAEGTRKGETRRHLRI